MTAINMTIQELLQNAIKTLSHSSSPKLDAQILLAQVLKVSRAYLYTWPEREMTPAEQAQFLELLARRTAGEPIAYILGQKEFWSLPLQVNAATLIPRPETELLVEQTLACLPADQPCRVLDLGTGSGAIALALAASRPHWQLTATDSSAGALAIAKTNAANLKLNNIQFYFGSWFTALPTGCHFDAILSNPPYIALGRPELEEGDLAFEPRSALTAGPEGLDDLKIIIHEAPAYLLPEGWLLLEHGYDQAEAVAGLLKAANFSAIASIEDYAGHPRVSRGQILPKVR